ncbi:MAG: FliA/WhiG family RNA polymerase sigma factor [Cellvibrio sp.]
MQQSVDYSYQDTNAIAPLMSASDEQKHLRQYLPLVKRIVNQLSLQASQSFDKEDMEQIGLMGLLESLRRYGIPDEQFAGFASLRVRGAILDELRRQDWRPRSVRQSTHKTRDAIRELTRKLSRQPSDEEILKFTGLSDKEYLEYLQADAGESLASLDEMLANGGEEFSDKGSQFEDRIIKQQTLTKALEQLDERERLILILYYQQELSLKEIALVLDLTDARVCQLSKQALAKACRFLNGTTQ